MRDCLFKKGLVYGILVLLVGVAVLPATGMVINKNIKLGGQQIVIEENSSNKW